MGVTLFFVLSGFLITYLLLEEKSEFKTINLKEFYIRRMLRIWPLYYLIIFLAFYIIPTFFSTILVSDNGHTLQINYYEKLAMYVLFVPNIAFITNNTVAFASQAWSIGVEEQFYAIWPLLVKYFGRICYVMIFIVLIYLIINITLIGLVNKTSGKSSPFFVYLNFFLVTRIDCMAVGGMFAYLALHQNRLSEIIQNKFVQLFVYAITIIFLSTNSILHTMGHLPFAILFGIIIFNLALNYNTIVHLNLPILEYGGKISYGIYMFHPLGITLTFLAYQKMNVQMNIVGSNIVLYGTSVLFTLLLSSFSYKFYEKYFLLKKIRFSRIISGSVK